MSKAVDVADVLHRKARRKQQSIKPFDHDAAPKGIEPVGTLEPAMDQFSVDLPAPCYVDATAEYHSNPASSAVSRQGRGGNKEEVPLEDEPVPKNPPSQSSK